MGQTCSTGTGVPSSSLAKQQTVRIGPAFGVIHDHGDSSRLRVLELSHLLPSVQIGVAVKTRRDLSAAAWEFIADLKTAAVGAQPVSAERSRAAKS